LVAAFFVAWHSLDGLEWDYHFVGIEGGKESIHNLGGQISLFAVCYRLWLSSVVVRERKLSRNSGQC
jgi:hypothetical protein